MLRYAARTADSVGESKVNAAGLSLMHKPGPGRLHEDWKAQISRTMTQSGSVEELADIWARHRFEPTVIAQDLAASVELLAAALQAIQPIGSTRQTPSGWSPLLRGPLDPATN
jgi:hypothetical protein